MIDEDLHGILTDLTNHLKTMRDDRRTSGLNTPSGSGNGGKAPRGGRPKLPCSADLLNWETELHFELAESADVVPWTAWPIEFEGNRYEARRSPGAFRDYYWSFMRDGGPCSAMDSEVTLVARLVPEGTVAQQEDVASDLPDPADVPVGEAWVVEVRGERRPAVKDRSTLAPWSTVKGTGKYENEDNDAVTLISRLVPDTRRVIDNAEDLDALPAGSAVLDPDGDVWQKSPTGNFVCGHLSLPSRDVITRRGTVTAIHVPEATD